MLVATSIATPTPNPNPNPTPHQAHTTSTAEANQAQRKEQGLQEQLPQDLQDLKSKLSQYKSQLQARCWGRTLTLTPTPTPIPTLTPTLTVTPTPTLTYGNQALLGQDPHPQPSP